MKIHVIGSGSTGNGYIIESNGKKLIVELGCKWKFYLEALKYDIENVEGALASHRHIDHLATLGNALQYLIPVYSNKEVAAEHPLVKPLSTEYSYMIGGFKVQCLKVPHNALCYSFIIKCPSGEKILFATDLSKFNYKVSGCDVIMMEANYDEDIIYEALARGEVVRSQSENHLEIKDCLEAVERCVDTNTQLIILLHLSDGYSNEKSFQKMVHKATGKRVCVAHAGQVYEINESDF